MFMASAMSWLSTIALFVRISLWREIQLDSKNMMITKSATSNSRFIGLGDAQTKESPFPNQLAQDETQGYEPGDC